MSRQPLCIQVAETTLCRVHLKKKYRNNMSSISSEIARSNDVFINHNFNNHEGEIPVWAVVEVISFGRTEYKYSLSAIFYSFS